MSDEEATDTRSRLLVAAVKLFAERGYGGTTVAAVSQMADANIAAVNYHFGDKKSLYEAALRWAFQAAWERNPVVPTEAVNPEAALRFHIHAMVRQIFSKDAGGYFARMFAKEIAEPSFAIDLIFSELMVRNRDHIRAVVQNILGPTASAEARQLGLLSVVAQFQFYNFNRAIRGMAGKLRPVLPEPERIADHIYEFSIAGLHGLKQRQLAHEAF